MSNEIFAALIIIYYCSTHCIGEKELINVILADIHSMLEFVETDEEAARKEFLKNKSKRTMRRA